MRPKISGVSGDAGLEGGNLLGRAFSRERAEWLASCAVPYEAALRSWLSSRRLPGLEIDDVVQETYTRLMQLEGTGGIRNSKAYMFQTAWSVLVTHVRRERVIALQTLADVDQLGLETDAPGPEQQVVEADAMARLRDAIAALPGNVGEVMRLRRLRGLSQKQVAAALGLAESTVEKHMHRALVLLLEHFHRGGNPGSKASKMKDSGGNARNGQGNRKGRR